MALLRTVKIWRVAVIGHMRTIKAVCGYYSIIYLFRKVKLRLSLYFSIALRLNKANLYE